MKRQVLWIAVAMLAASTSLVAQSSNNVDEVVRIERHTARNYREGEMIVKFKPTGAARMQSLTRGVSAGVNKVDEVFSDEYIRDAAFFGKNKSILLLGHYGAEFSGMRLLAKDLNETAAPTVFLDGGEVYRFL